MNLIIKFILFISLGSIGSAFAAEVVEYPTPKLSQAITLINEYLNGKPHRRTDIWNDLVVMDPRGPAFVDQALALLTENENPWKTYHEPRGTILTLIAAGVRGIENWPEFESSALKQSIHRSAQILLSKFPISKSRQREVVSIFDRLKLWDESDMPFLMKKFFNRSRFTPQITEFLRLFAKGSPEIKAAFADRVRRNQKKELLEYAILYRYELIQDNEIIWLLRLFMSDLFFGIARESVEAKPLLDWVLGDLHTRLRQGDPQILPAYEKVRASPNWGGNQVWSIENLEAMKQFLRDLWTGAVTTNCEALLESVTSDDNEAD